MLHSVFHSYKPRQEDLDLSSALSTLQANAVQSCLASLIQILTRGFVSNLML